MRPDPRALRLGLALFAAASLAPAASGQVLGRTDGRQAGGDGGYYVNALPNEPTIRVSVRGDLERPGVYDLGAGFDLESLVAIAGGPTVEPLDPRDPTVVVRLYRDQAGARALAYEALYASLVSGAEPAPGLADGDVVQVETTFERGVYVWGAVREPGYYEVGPDVDAVRLLALAGGPQGDGTRTSDVETDATVSILRPGVGTVYEASVEAFVAGRDAPALQDGDALQVEVVRRNRFTFRDALSIAGTVGTLVVIVLQIRAASNGD